MIMADHEVLSEESGSRLQHRSLRVVQDILSYCIQRYTVKSKSAGDTKNGCQPFMLSYVKPEQFTQTILWSSIVLAKN